MVGEIPKIHATESAPAIWVQILPQEEIGKSLLMNNTAVYNIASERWCCCGERVRARNGAILIEASFNPSTVLFLLTAVYSLYADFTPESKHLVE